MSSFISEIRRHLRPYSPRPQIHQRFFRRPLALRLKHSIVSFTFDDFPRSAFLNGVPLLEKFDCRGTFYTALGLMGTEDSRGPLFLADDLKTMIANGHEIACHTFSHVGARQTDRATFEAEILKNREQMEALIPGYVLNNFAYPGGELTFAVKRRMRKYSMSSRGTYKGINRTQADLDLLLSQYLSVGTSLEDVKLLVEECKSNPGWIIFYGHDVCEHPSGGGCTPLFMEKVLQIISAEFPIMTVAKAQESIRQAV